MTKKSDAPAIRFKGFSDAWEQRKFDEVFDCTVPNNTLSRAELSYDEGTVLNVHYGDVLIKYGSVLDVQKDNIPRIPYKCREDFNGALLQDGDIIIADTAEDETTGKACEIGNLQGSAIVSGLHTMVCRPRHRMALGYLGYYLNSNAYHHQLLPLMQGIKVLSLSRSNIQKTSVSYPTVEKEQQLIANYFSQLDHLITLHQRKFEKLTNVKKSMLEKMFPQNGSSYPEIRFKGFTDPWEQRKVSEIGNIITGSTPKTSISDNYGGEFLFVSPADIQGNRYVDETITTLTKKGFNQGRKIREGASLFVSIGSTIGKVAQTSQESTTNQQINAVEPYDNFDDDFIFTLLENISGSIKSIASNQAVPIVNKTTFGETEIQVPSELAEQQKIGAYFRNLDHLITLHQRKPFLMKWRTSDANRNQTNRLVL